MQENLEVIVKEYLAIHEDETSSLALLLEQLKKEDKEQLISRKNFVGHVTASIFIVTKGRKVLLLHHKKLDKLLQPGGHIDPDDSSPLNAALREVEEETGLLESCLSHRPLVPGREVVPFHIKTHHIPENVRKNEAAHYHHDFEYLSVVEDEHSVVINSSESIPWQWTDWDDFKKLTTFPVQAEKIERLLARSP